METRITEALDKKIDYGKRWPAPAKLNLMLRIIRRREDGYHLLQTVFQMLDLCDWITFQPLDDDRIILQNPLPGIPQDNDLTVQAAKLLKRHCGGHQGVGIEVEKNIPMGGGLGGGSSDAATTLVALNQYWQLGMTNEELMALGLKLGADVPVFVFGYAAWGEGIGEKLVKINIPEQWVVVVRPDVHIDTGEIFSNKELTRDSKSITIADFLGGDHQNDCLDIVRKNYQSVNEALNALSVFSEARLTGTGSCVFAQFSSKREASIAYQSMRDKWQVFLTKGQNISPLYQKFDQE